MQKTLYISIKSGSVDNRAELSKALKGLPDGLFELRITRKNKRSNQQNKYYWGCVVPLVHEGLRNMGYDLKDSEECHEIIKELFLKRKVSNGLEELFINGSTAKLNKLEFMEFIDRVAQWCSEYLGFQLPYPGEQTGFDFLIAEPGNGATIISKG